MLALNLGHGLSGSRGGSAVHPWQGGTSGNGASAASPPSAMGGEKASVASAAGVASGPAAASEPASAPAPTEDSLEHALALTRKQIATTFQYRDIPSSKDGASWHGSFATASWCSSARARFESGSAELVGARFAH